MRPSCALDRLALLIVLLGAVNWGLVGVIRFDLIAWIFGGMSFGQTSGWSRGACIIVGLAGIYWLVVPTLVGASMRAGDRDQIERRRTRE